MTFGETIKYLPWLLVVLAIGGVAFYYWNNSRNLEALMNQANAELQTAKLEIGRANTKIADADLLVSKLNTQIQQDIKERNGHLTLIAELQAKYAAEKKKVKTITRIVYQDRTIDLPKGQIFVRLEDGTYKEVTSLTYSYKDFRIDISGDAIQQTISYKLHQRFRAVFAESKLPGGAINHYAELYELDDKGKDTGRMTLEKFEVVKSEALPSKMMWWNPKIDLQLAVRVTTAADFGWLADVGFSTSAYGHTPDDITWRFFRLGAGITGWGFSLSFSPAQYNVGKVLPLVSNLWITPWGGYDFGIMQPHFGLGISVVF